MDVEAKRLKTFFAHKANPWPFPASSSMAPQLCARAGFFFAPEQGVANSDRVVCFACAHALGDWEAGDDPYAEHAKWYPTCPFIVSGTPSARRRSSGDFGGYIQKLSQSGDPPKKPDPPVVLVRHSVDVRAAKAKLSPTSPGSDDGVNKSDSCTSKFIPLSPSVGQVSSVESAVSNAIKDVVDAFGDTSGSSSAAPTAIMDTPLHGSSNGRDGNVDAKCDNGHVHNKDGGVAVDVDSSVVVNAEAIMDCLEAAYDEIDDLNDQLLDYKDEVQYLRKRLELAQMSAKAKSSVGGTIDAAPCGT